MGGEPDEHATEAGGRGGCRGRAWAAAPSIPGGSWELEPAQSPRASWLGVDVVSFEVLTDDICVGITSLRSKRQLDFLLNSFKETEDNFIHDAQQNFKFSPPSESPCPCPLDSRDVSQFSPC